jgi:hypothetical protein
VIYANGKSNRTKSFGLFRINPRIKPGAEVVLPETDAKKEKAINCDSIYYGISTGGFCFGYN